MRLTIERKPLVTALGRVHRVVERRNTVPILGNVLMRAEGAQLHLRATDLDVEIAEPVAAEVDEPGAVTVPAHMLHDIVRKLPEGAQVSIAQDGDRIALRAGRARFSLPTLPASDFPDLASGEMPHRFVLPSGDLKRMIEKVQFAISSEETRYYLNGIYLHVASAASGRKVLRAVATDGHRLAQFDLPVPDGADAMPGIIVPRKTVGEVLRLLDVAADITVEVSATKVRVTAGGAVLTSKLIDGTYPDYVRVIPTNNDRTVKLRKAEIAAAVERVAVVSSERGRAVKLSLSAGQLVLAVTNPDAGSATEEIEAEYFGDPLDVGFNSRYLLDIAALIDGALAVVNLGDPGSPALIQDESSDEALYVLMPMRVT